MHKLADCIKAIQGMTGKARKFQAAQDQQCIIDATQAHLQANPNKFEETVTPANNRNTQQVLRVQAPPSVPTLHTNDNRQNTHSMQPQPPILRVPNDISKGKSISAPLIASTIEPTGKLTHATGTKLTTLPANLSKCECHRKR